MKHLFGRSPEDFLAISQIIPQKFRLIRCKELRAPVKITFGLKENYRIIRGLLKSAFLNANWKKIGFFSAREKTGNLKIRWLEWKTTGKKSPFTVSMYNRAWLVELQQTLNKMIGANGC